MGKQHFALEESIGYFIGNTYHSLRALLRKHFTYANIDVTHEQWIILNKLWLKDGQNQMELSAETKKDKTSITRLINRLEKRNFVVRIPDKEDKRNKLVYLTQKGRELQEEAISQVRKTLKIVQKNIDPEEIACCKNVMRQMVKNIDGRNI